MEKNQWCQLFTQGTSARDTRQKKFVGLYSKYKRYAFAGNAATAGIGWKVGGFIVMGIKI